jgi:hypothetical protein
VIITRRSPFSGKTHSMDIPVTEEQIACWKKGVLIQKAMPQLTASQREFIKTGITEEEWNESFGPEEDD